MVERFVQNSKNVICKKCGQKKPHYKDMLKKVNICEDCFDNYQKTKVTCSVCGKKHPRNTSYFNLDEPIKNSNFCSQECYTSHKNDLLQKDEMDLWLKDYFKVDTLPVKIYADMSYYKTHYGISYNWTFITLRYWVNIKGKRLQEGTIGIVPRVYEECKEYTLKTMETKRKAQDVDRKMAKFADEITIVKKFNTNKEREKKINKRLISEDDLEGIVW